MSLSAPDPQDMSMRLLLVILGLVVMLVGFYRWAT